jgi:PRTRC genetic system protein B
MKINIDSGTSKMELRGAILLYADAGTVQGNTCFASFHDVKNMGKAEQPNVQIMPGTPLNQQALMQTLGSLADRYAISTDLLPEYVLSYSPLHLIWWMPAGKRRVFLKTAADGAQSEIVPHPALLFAIVQGSWYVFAMKGNARPTKATALFHAPFFNMYDDGSVCVGTAKAPQSTLLAETGEWERAFFDSVFTHVNEHRKVKYRGGEYGLWRSLMKGKRKEFPETALMSNGHTLGSLMASLLTFKESV